jgi:hypothetical protein
MERREKQSKQVQTWLKTMQKVFPIGFSSIPVTWYSRSVGIDELIDKSATWMNALSPTPDLQLGLYLLPALINVVKYEVLCIPSNSFRVEIIREF